MDGSIHVGGQKLPSQLLPVSFVAPVMLDLDVKVETPFTTVQTLTRLVGAYETPIDFACGPPEVLLAPILGLSFIIIVILTVTILFRR